MIEQKVAALLDELDVTSPPVDVYGAAKRRGAKVRKVPGDERLSGMLYRHAAQVIIGVNADHHPNRQRFTVAHELGHLSLHGGDIYLDAADPLIHRRDDISSLGTDDEEIEANQFAASLLMPSAFIQSDIEAGLISPRELSQADPAAIERLARRYQVSSKAMGLRLANLGLVAGSFFASDE